MPVFNGGILTKPPRLESFDNMKRHTTLGTDCWRTTTVSGSERAVFISSVPRIDFRPVGMGEHPLEFGGEGGDEPLLGFDMDFDSRVEVGLKCAAAFLGGNASVCA